MTAKLRQELIGIGALAAGVFLGLTLLPFRITGAWGQEVGGILWRALGVGAVMIPVLGVGCALAAFERLGALSSLRTAALGAGLIVLVPYGIGIASGVELRYLPADSALWTPTQKLVGLVAGLLAHTIRSTVGTAGGVLFGLFALSALGILTVGWHPLVVLRGSGERSGGTVGGPAARRSALPPEGTAPRSPLPEPAVPLPAPRSSKARPTKPDKRPPVPAPPPGALIPPIDLLTPAPPEDGDAGLAQIEQMGQKLIETLQTFRVEGRIAGRTVGPVVTQYEVAPGPGVKVGRIAALADDLALAMRAQSLRIVAPIPGKAAVGIEVPNPMPRLVHIRELLEAREYAVTRALPIALGKNLEGDPVVADLAKMPHLLIAGATGSGKSVSINTIITSLVYHHPPERLKFLMIDPKMVELAIYADLPHLVPPVVTEHARASKVFRWAVQEMERRYRLLHANHARNVADFNRKVEEKRPLVDAEMRDAGSGMRDAGRSGDASPIPPPASRQPYTGGVLPYLVLIVDELADLVLTMPGEIETPLAMLAQKARAVGVHLILATQRPSVNVITGLIKANFPCRVAFRVSAKVDSRTILDQNGAETLLGNGDMLFLPPGKSELVRLQGAFISTDETERVLAWYKSRARQAAAATQAGQQMSHEIDSMPTREEQERGREEEPASGERDSLFRQAAETCIQHQLGSTSLLQRRMSIGYGRAARIIDQLEQAGILGPANGSKPRDVLVGLEELDEICGA